MSWFVCLQLSEAEAEISHAQRALAAVVRGDLVQLLDTALAQHRQAAALACAGQASAAASEAVQHFLHLDLPASQVRQLAVLHRYLSDDDIKDVVHNTREGLHDLLLTLHRLGNRWTPFFLGWPRSWTSFWEQLMRLKWPPLQR